MSVEFEEENQAPVYTYKSRQIQVFGPPTTPPMIRFLVEKHFVKNEKNAVRVLSVLTILFFLAAIIVLLYAFNLIHNPFAKAPVQQPIPYELWKTLPPDIQKTIPHQPPTVSPVPTNS